MTMFDSNTPDINKKLQNLEVVRVDAERNLLLIKGALPGANGCLLFVRDSVKA